MTALTDYQRLECTGLWRSDGAAQRRDVIVSLGEASLVISDQTDQALAHWSLPAIERRGTDRPAIFAPGPDASEELEVDDPDMIAAIERVQGAIRRRRPRPGRLRSTVFTGGVAVALVLALLWLPGALVRHASAIVPQTLRTAVGADLLERLERVTGPVCMTPRGTAALRRLNERLRGAGAGPLLVVPGGIATSAHLPGGTILINRALVEDFETPEVAAGYVLAEEARRGAGDPLLQVLRAAGPVATVRLLATGRLPAPALDRVALGIPSAQQRAVPLSDLLPRFAAAQVSMAPFAYARDVSGEATLPLIEADPVGTTATPLLSDADWVALQEICGG